MDIISIINRPDHCRKVFSEFTDGNFEEVEGIGNTPGNEYISLFGTRGHTQISFRLFKDGRADIEEDGDCMYYVKNPFRFVDRMRELGYSPTP